MYIQIEMKMIKKQKNEKQNIQTTIFKTKNQLRKK